MDQLIGYHHAIRYEICIVWPRRGGVGGLIFPLKKSGQAQNHLLGTLWAQATLSRAEWPVLSKVEGERARESSWALS